MITADLSIVIVNWNTRELLRDCLRAVAVTTGVTCEVIVVDNGSTDGSAAVVATEFPTVHLIANATNRGFAAANNQGLAVARGRYCLLLNSDTRVAPDALAQLVAFMDAHPEAGACGPQLRNADGTLQPSGRAFPTLVQAVMALLPLPDAARRAAAGPLERRDYNSVAEVDEVSGAALCLRAAALSQVGGLDERFFVFGEDVDLCWRLSKAGWKVYYVPQAVVTHLWGGSRRHLSERMSLLAQRAYVLLMRKHRPGRAAAVITRLVFVLTLAKAVRRILPTLLRGDRAAAMTSWRAHRAELTWLKTQ